MEMINAMTWGTDLFCVFYYHQPFLPLWITGAQVWWFGQLLYRRRHGLLSSPQLAQEMTWLSVAWLSAAVLGPLPYYIWLLHWLRVRLREFQTVPFLKAWNWALAIFMLVTFIGHTALDLHLGVERQVSRVLRQAYLEEMLTGGRITGRDVCRWARERQGKLQANAVYLLRFCSEPEAGDILNQLAAGSTRLAELARQSREYRDQKLNSDRSGSTVR